MKNICVAGVFLICMAFVFVASSCSDSKSRENKMVGTIEDDYAHFITTIYYLPEFKK